MVTDRRDREPESRGAGPTVTYIKRRELVLGRRFRLSRDPEIAAAQLVEQAGGARLARRWALDLVEQIEREHPSAGRAS